jgi:hypothetical protein
VVASPLARKPYDFRHAGVSWRLDGHDERWHERMEDFLD